MSTPLRDRMIADLQPAGLSERTQQAYLVRQLAVFYHMSPEHVTEEQLREYFLHLKNEKRFAASSQKIAYCGIRFLFTQTLKRDWDTLAMVRAQPERRLPDVLTVAEVHRLINAVRTLHNKTYLWTLYSCGLRLQKGLSLRVGDLDGLRLLVHVPRGKGDKDRYVPLPERTLTADPKD